MNTLSIVAHPDDDLLFLNPDIAQDLEQGDSVYTVYLTAGDDGRDGEYVYRREKAIQNAYLLYKRWNHIYYHLKSNSFRNGDPYGQLYALAHNETVTNLDNKLVTAQMLHDAIRHWVAVYDIGLVRTHDPDAAPAVDHDEPHLDHMDHVYTGRHVQQALKGMTIPLWAYTGYPIRGQEPNLDDLGTVLKRRMWRAYQVYDNEAGEQWDIALTRCYKRQLQ